MDIEKGIKSFEIRFNDRDFKVGDFLHLQEYCGGEYTGREMSREVCYMIDSPEYCKEGFVVLGLKEDYSLSMFPSDVRELKSPFDERAEQFASICDQLIQNIKNTKEERNMLKDDGTLEMIPTVESVRQEVAREIINTIKDFIRSDKGRIYSSEYHEMVCHNIGVESTKNALEDLVEELEKKYIGE